MRDPSSTPSALLEDLLAFCLTFAVRVIDSPATPRDPRQRRKQDVVRDLVLTKLDLVTRDEHDLLKAQVAQLAAQIESLTPPTPRKEKTNHTSPTPSTERIKESKKQKAAPQKKSKNLRSVKHSVSARRKGPESTR